MEWLESATEKLVRVKEHFYDFVIYVLKIWWSGPRSRRRAFSKYPWLLRAIPVYDDIPDSEIDRPFDWDGIGVWI